MAGAGLIKIAIAESERRSGGHVIKGRLGDSDDIATGEVAIGPLRIQSRDQDYQRAVRLAQIYQSADRESGFEGLEQVAARKAIRRIKASTFNDLLRTGTDPDVVAEAIRRVQEMEVEKFREDPTRLNYADLGRRIGWDATRGDYLKTFFHGLDAIADGLDLMVSRKTAEPEFWSPSSEQHWAGTVTNFSPEGGPGRMMTLGQYVAGAAQQPELLDNPTTEFKAVSGSVDVMKRVLVDPLIGVGKVVKLLRLGKVLKSTDQIAELAQSRPVQRWAGKMAKEDSQTLISESARFGGSDMPDAVAKRLSRVFTKEEMTDVLVDAGKSGELRVLPVATIGRDFTGGASVWGNRSGISRFGQRIWMESLPDTSPHFADDIRSAAKYLHGSKGNNWARAADKVLSMPAERQYQAAADFWENGLDVWRKRLNVPDDAWEASIAAQKKAGIGLFAMRDQAFGWGLINDGLRPPMEMPMFRSQLGRNLIVPSYRNLLGLKRSLTGTAAVGKIDELSQLNALRAYWVATPRTTMRNMIDDVFGAIGHPEHGGLVLSQMKDQFAALPGIALAQGGKVLRKLTTKQAKSSQVARTGGVFDDLEQATLKVDDDLKPLIDEQDFIAKNRDPALHVRSARVSETLSGLVRGPIPDAARGAAKELVDLDRVFYGNINRGQPGYILAANHFVNHVVLQDDMARVMLANWDNGGAKAVHKWLETGEGKQYLSLMPPWMKDNPRQWAQGMEELIRKTIPKGELLDRARQAGQIPVSMIERNVNTMAEFYPGPVPLPWMGGQTAIKTIAKTVANARDKYFGWAGAATDYIGRVPAHRAFYDSEIARVKKLAEQTGAYGNTVTDEMIDQIAGRYATREVAKRFDTPVMRSRGGEYLRAFIGFGDAHARFWTRWGRLALENPGYVEKIRLMFGGMQDLGWIQTDERGNLTAQIPIMPELFEKLGVLPYNLGKDWFRFTLGQQKDELGKGALAGAIFPKGMPFSVETLPGFMPLLTFPVDWLTKERPGLSWLRNTILGEYGSKMDPNKSIYDNLASYVVTGWMEKVAKSFYPENAADRDMQQANATKDAIAALVYEGADMSDPKTIERARRMAKVMWFSKGMMQAISPWTPSEFPYHREMVEDIRHWQRTEGNEVATLKVAEKYGESAWAYTVPKSGPGKMATGEKIKPPLATEAAEQFVKANPAFFTDYGNVAGYFTYDLEGEFSINAWSEQFKRGQRVSTPPAEWVAWAMYIKGNREYYEQVKPQFTQAKAAGVDDAILNRWRELKRLEIDQKYPGWLMGYESYGIRAAMREKSIRDLKVVIADPAVADMPITNAVSEWLTLYDQAYSVAYSNGYQTIGANRLAPLRAEMANRAAAIKSKYRSSGFDAIYESLFRYEIEGFDE